jgi:hypothetical protein
MMEHVFGAAQAAGHLFLVGSDYVGHAIVCVSDDDGATWEQQLTSEAAADFERFYFAAVLNGAVYLQDHGAIATSAWKWTLADGWQPVDAFLPIDKTGGKSRALGAGVVIQGNESASTRAGTLYYFDGVSPATPLTSVTSWTVHDGLIWAVRQGVIVTVTADGVVTPVRRPAMDRAGVTFTAIAVLADGSILLGSSDGQVAYIPAANLA